MTKGIWLLAVSAVVPVLADVEFRAAHMTRGDVPPGIGQCDIRLQVDKDAEVRVRGDRISIRTFSGQPSADDGSECNAPMPAQDLPALRFDVKDSRGDIVLASTPNRRNGYAAVVRIRDSAGGAGRYHFRLSWNLHGYYAQARPHEPVHSGNPFGVKEAIRVCQDAVVSRINNEYRHRDVEVTNIRADDRPGRRDYVLGEAVAGRGPRAASFTFACSVDFNTGRVRTADVRQR